MHGLQVRVGLDDKILRLSRKGNLRFKGTWSDICPLSRVVSFLKGKTDSDMIIDLGAANGNVSLSINAHDAYNSKHFTAGDRKVLSDTAIFTRYLDVWRKKSQTEIKDIVQSARS